MPQTGKCCLCGQIEGRKDNDLIAQLLPGVPYARRIMMESASFAALPSLGPLVKGHTLLCPKSHIRSFASFGRRLHAEYLEVKNRLKNRLCQIYASEITLFEHGMATDGDRILCTVDHAHMHFLPLGNTSLSRLPGEDRWTEFDGTLEMLRQLTRGREYIYSETPDGAHRVLTRSSEVLASQYMRKVIAKKLGHPQHWDWKATPNPKAADETWRQYIQFPQELRHE